jgi:hypothetical protein
MLPKNPPPLCHRKQLKLRDQSTAVFVAKDFSPTEARHVT